MSNKMVPLQIILIKEIKYGFSINRTNSQIVLFINVNKHFEKEIEEVKKMLNDRLFARTEFIWHGLKPDKSIENMLSSMFNSIDEDSDDNDSIDEEILIKPENSKNINIIDKNKITRDIRFVEITRDIRFVASHMKEYGACPDFNKQKSKDIKSSHNYIKTVLGHPNKPDEYFERVRVGVVKLQHSDKV